MFFFMKNIYLECSELYLFEKVLICFEDINIEHIGDSPGCAIHKLWNMS